MASRLAASVSITTRSLARSGVPNPFANRKRKPANVQHAASGSSGGGGGRGPIRAPLEIQMLPTRDDNYVYLFRNRRTNQAGVVDPSDAGPVLDAATKLGWTLQQVICTHYHDDHTGGNLGIKAAMQDTNGVTVTGPASETLPIPGLDVAVSHGGIADFAGVSATVIGTEGHTKGHVSYYLADQGAVFVGDTLFVLGCGRLFEGTPEDMWRSLQRLAALPDDTLVYCGHEYTLGNLEFALCVEQDNRALRERAEKIRALRSHGDPTVPTTIGLERATNPFMRCNLPELKAAIGMPGCSDVEAFAEIRARKDMF